MKNTSKKNYQNRKRKAYKSKYKGRTKGGKLGYLSSRQSISFPFPSSVAVKFRCSVLINFSYPAAAMPDAGTGNPSNQVFKLNSLLAVGSAAAHPISGALSTFPNNVPAGLYNLLSQSLGIASGSTAVYQRYFVRKSKIIVQACTEGTTNKTLSIAIVPLTDNFGTVSALTNLVEEQPFAKVFLLPPVLNETPKRLTHEISVKKLYGLSTLDNSESDYCGDCSTNSGNPMNTAVWLVRVANADGQSDNAYNGTMKVTLEFDTLLFDRNIVNSLIPAVSV